MENTIRPNIIPITDFCAPELDVYARLTEGQLLNRHEPEKGMFIAESPRVIERALDYGCIPVSILIETRQIETQGKEIIARCGQIPVYTAPFDVLTQLTGFQNGVVLTPACSNPLYRRAIRVSMGTVFQIPWAFLPEGAQISRLHVLGFKTVAMALKEDSLRMDAPQLAKEPRLAIVLGTEGDGLAADTIEACDYTVRIPMAQGVDSLNVAAASAVAFWQLGTVRDRGIL